MKVIGFIGGILCGLVAFCVAIVVVGCFAALFIHDDDVKDKFEEDKL